MSNTAVLFFIVVFMTLMVGCSTPDPTVAMPMTDPVEVDLGDILRLLDEDEEAAKRQYEGLHAQFGGVVSGLDDDKIKLVRFYQGSLRRSVLFTTDGADCKIADKNDQAVERLKLELDKAVVVKGIINKVSSSGPSQRVELKPCYFVSKLN